MTGSLKQFIRLSIPLHRIGCYQSADRLRHLIADCQQRPVQRRTQSIHHVLQELRCASSGQTCSATLGLEMKGHDLAEAVTAID